MVTTAPQLLPDIGTDSDITGIGTGTGTGVGTGTGIGHVSDTDAGTATDLGVDQQQGDVDRQSSSQVQRRSESLRRVLLGDQEALLAVQEYMETEKGQGQGQSQSQSQGHGQGQGLEVGATEVVDAAAKADAGADTGTGADTSRFVAVAGVPSGEALPEGSADPAETLLLAARAATALSKKIAAQRGELQRLQLELAETRAQMQAQAQAHAQAQAQAQATQTESAPALSSLAALASPTMQPSSPLALSPSAKISYRDFQVGCIALFMPLRYARKYTLDVFMHAIIAYSRIFDLICSFFTKPHIHSHFFVSSTVPPIHCSIRFTHPPVHPPTASSPKRDVYMAFNHRCPHHYLSEESLTSMIRHHEQLRLLRRSTSSGGSSGSSSASSSTSGTGNA